MIGPLSRGMRALCTVATILLEVVWAVALRMESALVAGPTLALSMESVALMTRLPVIGVAGVAPCSGLDRHQHHEQSIVTTRSS
jgi:hypothetical protein